MQSDLLSCPVCYIQYSEDDHLPKIIPVCGHTLCSFCLDQILQKNKQCPLDRIKLQKTKSYPTNYVVLQLVKEKQANEYGICLQHNKPRDFVCSMDYLMICEECVPNHKDHKIQNQKDIRKDAQVQKKKLEAVIDGIASHRERVESLLIESKKSVLTNLTQEFEKVREAIKQKEKEIFCMVESAFDDRKEELEKILEKDVLLTEKCMMKMSDLETPMNRRFFKTLEKLEGETFGHSIKEQVEGTKLQEEQYAFDLQKLSSLLNFKIHNICFMVSDVLNTNMIEIDELDPLERALYFCDTQDGKLFVAPRNCPATTSTALDYHLLKNIKSFSVSCEDNFTYEHFRALKSIYTFTDKISEIELDLSKITDNYEGIRLFYSDLYWVTQIESFTLNLDGYYTNDSLMGLAKNALLNMTSMKKLTLIINESEITDTTLQILALYFAKTPVSLSKFHLQLWETEERTDLNMAELFLRDQSILTLCENANKFLKIKKLTLRLRSVRITEKSIVTLSDKILSKMPLLESLSLLLIEMQLTDQGFIKLCSNLTQIAQNLKKFALNVADNLITDTSVNHFAKHLLPELKNLKHFQLHIGKTAIEDRTVQELCERFTPILRRAETFVLHFLDSNYFSKESGVSEVGVEMIIDLVKLETMSNLKTFNIYHPITSDERKRATQKLTEIEEQLTLRQR